MGEHKVLHSYILPGSQRQDLPTVHFGRRLHSPSVKKQKKGTILVSEVCNGASYACGGTGVGGKSLCALSILL